MIRTNLLFMTPDDRLSTLLVTSDRPQEGKTTTAINIGLSMAISGSKTLILDADMRRPRVHKSFEIGNERGLSTVIVGETNLDESIHQTEVENLHVLPSGPIPPNPAELLHTESFKNLLEELGETYDRVILDSPPVSAVTDAVVLGSMLDGSIFVLRHGKTRLSSAQQAVRRLQDVGSNLLGAVLNDLSFDEVGQGYRSKYYYYNYNYSADNEHGTNADTQAAA